MNGSASDASGVCRFRSSRSTPILICGGRPAGSLAGLPQPERRQPGSFGWLRDPRRKQAGSLAWFRSGPGPQTASDSDENVKSLTLSAGTTTGCDTSPDSDADTATGSPIASMLLSTNTGDSL